MSARKVSARKWAITQARWCVDRAKVRQVWAYVSEHPTATLTQIATGTGLGRTMCARAMQMLKDAGHIEHAPRSKQARRVVVPLVTSGFRVVARRRD